MVKWQTEIYSGEIAETVKSEYRKLLAIKKTDDDVEKIIVEHCMSSMISDPQDEGRMWLALALRQWEYGRLSDLVKTKALYWLKQSIYGISKEASEMLDRTIKSPMPTKKSVQLPSYIKKCPWPIGSLLAYRIVSHPDEKIRSGPFWGKYVLLRIIGIVREPYTELAPDSACNEGMLVGLYKWWGNEIPNPSIVETLEFTPVSVIGPSLSASAFNRLSSDIAERIGANIISSAVSTLTSSRVETCCRLDWVCAKGIHQNDVFTYIGCDPSFQDGIADFFKTRITDYAFCHSIPFDAMLHKRLTQLADER